MGGFVDDRAATVRELNVARQKWRGLGLSDYRYQFRQICFCAPPVTTPALVTVRGGSLVDAVYVASGDPVADASRIPTIDGLFAQLQEAVDERAAEVRVQYDATLGFPTQIYIYRDRRMADEEIGYEVSAVEDLR